VDGYSAALPLEALMEEGSVIVWAMNGEPLPRRHGAPARLVVPTRYAWKSVKYFGTLEVLEDAVPGYWEAVGYTPFLLSGLPRGPGGPGLFSRDGAARRVDAAPSASANIGVASPPGALAGGGAGSSLPMTVETHLLFMN
jgi:DMSO/TMAO reductase YedYZ molybdopterin-dependent catalytic subunit